MLCVAAAYPQIMYRQRPLVPHPATASNKEITLNDLRKYFHLPITEVASRLGTCTTALKKVCRRLNISKWPYRQILSITKSIQSIEMASMADQLDEKQREHFREQLTLLHRMLTEVIKHPNKTIDDCHMILDPDAADEPGDTPSGAYTGQGEKEGEEEEGEGEGGEDSNTVNATITKAQTQPLRSESEDPTEEIVQQLIKSAADNMNASLTFIGRSRKRKSDPAFDHDLAFKQGGGGNKRTNDKTNDRTNAEDLTNLRHRDVHAHEALQTQIQAIDQQLHPASSSSSSQPQAKASTSYAPVAATATVAKEGASHDHSSWPQLELGQTKLKFSHDPENDTYTFLGPIQLAPLQRRKFKANNSGQQRRIVPLMEPDVGGNASVEFLPQTIVNALKKKMDDHNLMEMTNALQFPTDEEESQAREQSREQSREDLREELRDEEQSVQGSIYGDSISVRK